MTFQIAPNSVLVSSGLLVGFEESDLFGLPLSDGIDLAKADSFAVCRICGAIYVATCEMQVIWLDSHNDLHTPQEHYDLEVSNRACTTEAFSRLESYGLQSIVGHLH